MKLSDSGRKLIERFEGCRLQAYQDIVGVWTIGYGCTGPNVHEGFSITPGQADQMLSDRLAYEFEPGINRLLGDAPTMQGQFDAMCSLAFNIGLRAFAHSTVLRNHLAQHYDDAADAFLMWDHAGGREIEALANRRQVEGQLYMDSSPDS